MSTIMHILLTIFFPFSFSLSLSFSFSPFAPFSNFAVFRLVWWWLTKSLSLCEYANSVILLRLVRVVYLLCSIQINMVHDVVYGTIQLIFSFFPLFDFIAVTCYRCYCSNYNILLCVVQCALCLVISCYLT